MSKIGFDFIGVAVVYFCHDGNGKVVLGKRNNNARDEHGRWDIGGGSVEFGDTIENTLCKEIKEEYCTDVLDFEFLGYRDVHRESQGLKTHWISLDFKVLVNPDQVAIGEPDKFDAVDWFTISSLPTPVHSQLPHFLELYKNKL